MVSAYGVAMWLYSSRRYEFVMIHSHRHPVCDFLRDDARVSWLSAQNPHELILGLVVWHRGDRMRLVDEELPEKDVVWSLL